MLFEEILFQSIKLNLDGHRITSNLEFNSLERNLHLY